MIVFLPIGTGAASNLWAAVADDWHATADTVALVTGALSGIISAAGCLAGGYLCDRLDRKTAYALFGVVQAACAVAMEFSPRTQAMYVVFTMTYALINGLTYAAFSAVTLEAIGWGAAATKYSLFASLSNMPIAYMTVMDGWPHTPCGPRGMLNTEAAISIAAVVVFTAVYAMTTKRRSPAI